MDRLFCISGDLDAHAHVFHYGLEKVQAAGRDGKVKQRRPEYKMRNKYFVTLSFVELVRAIEDEKLKDK